jgi:hypothetical protein
VTFIPSLVPFTINRAGRNVVKARPVAETPAMDGKEGNMGRNVIIFYSIILYYIIYIERYVHTVYAYSICISCF